MESYVKQLDTTQEICKVEIKEEVFFELIEDQSYINGINEESVIIKEEHFESIDDQSFIPNGFRNENIIHNQIKKELSNDDQDENIVFINEEQETDDVWSEATVNEPDPLALAETIYTDETRKSAESDSLPRNSNEKDSETSSHKAYYYDPTVKQYIAADKLCDFPYSTSDLIVKNYTCEKLQTSRSELITSITVHTRVRPYKCKECEYSTSKSNDLKIHIRKHTGEKPYKCKVCEYSASNSCSLKRHERKHTGDRPYKCKECDYTCAQLASLIRHRRMHSGERPFKCKECGYACIQSSSLISHMKIHEVKPFKCNKCDYSSRRPISLEKHMYKHMKKSQNNT